MNPKISRTGQGRREAGRGESVINGVTYAPLLGKGQQKGAKLTHLVLNEGCEGEIIEEIGEVSPDVGVSVLSQTLVVEAVNLSDLTRFVVASEDGDAIAIPQFHRDEESDGFDGIVSSVYVITHEEVVGIG
jgi:hypothetical protein